MSRHQPAVRSPEPPGPNWVFNGLTPEKYLAQALTWASHGVQLIGGCCGTGPEHITQRAAHLISATR